MTVIALRMPTPRERYRDRGAWGRGLKGAKLKLGAPPPPAGTSRGTAAGSGWPHSPMPYAGVRVVGIVEDNTPFTIVHDPGHPDADQNGDVLYPNIDPIMEMVDLIESNRAYESNMSVFETTKQLLMRTLAIGR